MNKNVIYFSLFIKQNKHIKHYAMLYWSLKTLSKFYQNKFDIIVFYDSDIINFKFENIHINNYNMTKDFPFVKFIKLDYVNHHKNEEEPFRIKFIPWMFKWFCLEKIFQLNYEKILFLDVDTVFYKDPIIIFDSLIEEAIYVNNGIKSEILFKKNIRNGLAINSGQFYLSNINIKNFYDLYYKFRLELYKECKFKKRDIRAFDLDTDGKIMEQWAGLMVFDFCKIEIKILPSNLIHRGSIIKKTCIFHYEHQKLADQILPQYLHIPEIKKLSIKNT